MSALPHARMNCYPTNVQNTCESKQAGDSTITVAMAAQVEVLECTQPDDHTTKELMRITIEAPGWAGKLCAPRVFPVERILKTDEVRACM